MGLGRQREMNFENRLQISGQVEFLLELRCLDRLIALFPPSFAGEALPKIIYLQFSDRSSAFSILISVGSQPEQEIRTSNQFGFINSILGENSFCGFEFLPSRVCNGKFWDELRFSSNLSFGTVLDNKLIRNTVLIAAY